ncbi:hypothetical protein [Kribbella albertanoniae]|nr:hypothetical protein [Kribbella albertanoniae]
MLKVDQLTLSEPDAVAGAAYLHPPTTFGPNQWLTRAQRRTGPG